ncbi:MAG: hypothetical protein VYA42_04010, partial [Pseudomonadota bacterium]|nr:hypothetical protein [Pseudomonadota bacterium]
PELWQQWEKFRRESRAYHRSDDGHGHKADPPRYARKLSAVALEIQHERGRAKDPAKHEGQRRTDEKCANTPQKTE